METMKLVFQLAGMIVLTISICGTLLFILFYKRCVIEYVDQEMEDEMERHRPLTIDDLVN